ncbi:hypothetical protein CWI37_1371p0010 [Hamiltosporidium tvaerminnensis]|uniref:Uncharacterized protein n=1 Tax=Hamiltosporidium tvaerminnensis TaxID=1176355 RepID=A0A4Q9KWU3_9MICR|nr:hypothetical protein CWI37_1371p0010 [Hamiltosporidium tvaerminnensis]
MRISLRTEEQISKYLETFVPKKRNIKILFKRILNQKLKNNSILKFIIYLQKTGIYKKYVTKYLIKNYYIFDISGLYLCSEEEKVRKVFCNYNISKTIYSFKNFLFDEQFYLFGNNFEYFDDPKSPFLLDLYGICQQIPQTEDSWTLTLTTPEHLMCLVRNVNFKNLLLFKLWYYKIEVEKPDEIFKNFIEIDQLWKTWRKIGFPKQEELLKYKEICKYKENDKENEGDNRRGEEGIDRRGKESRIEENEGDNRRGEEGIDRRGKESRIEEGNKERGKESRIEEGNKERGKEGRIEENEDKIVEEEHKIIYQILPPNTSLINNEEDQTSDSEERESKDLYLKRMYIFTPQNERPNVSNEDLSRRKSNS